MGLVRRALSLAACLGCLVVGCTHVSNSGTLTGFIDPCVGAIATGRPMPPYAAGTVVALRGDVQLRKVPGGEQELLPTSVASRVHVDEGHAFRLRLSPGRYVVVGYLDNSGDTRVTLPVTIARGESLHRNLPTSCK